MSRERCTITVLFGNDEKTATVRFSHRSRPVVATLLGVDKDPAGNPIQLYFNSLIHSDDGKNVEYFGWKPSGCISTILTKVGKE